MPTTAAGSTATGATVMSLPPGVAADVKLFEFESTLPSVTVCDTLNVSPASAALKVYVPAANPAKL